VLPALKRDFVGRCCYCTGSTLEKGGEENFDVEHFRPRGRAEFAHLEFTYSNLYYACRGCNLAKGPKWPDPGDPDTRFIDPCEEAIYPKYLRIADSGEILACLSPGSYLLNVFRFNKRPGVRRMLRVRGAMKQLFAAVREEKLEEARAILDGLQKTFAAEF
jgi:hypothetical protein